ncbi:MAG: UMP kinase [Nanoarchaeota archaeon]|nr:UMP kinase [Nanoarchaeota archaeon]MBU0963244.1 UMP kinase [Nanoarchaeota archaeon]
MKEVVISLGGSLIFQDSIDYNYIKQLKNLLLKYSKKFKFVIVVGGGKTARTYMDPLIKEKLSEKEVCLTGIRITRLNARFMHKFFGKNPGSNIPKELKEVKNILKKNNIVFCGSLRYKADNTSDGTAAEIASYLNTNFVNLTNVEGLYTKDPRKFKDAKFIPKISFKDFYKMADFVYKPGQHFVLDQSAARIILKNKIKTVIMNGKKLKNFENFLNNKGFIGTIIN